MPSETEPHQVNTTVQTLNLGYNEVGADGASALAAALQAAFVLRTVCLLVSYTVESERTTSMSDSEGSYAPIVAFRVDSGESVLSIHHGPMVTCECCNETSS